MPPIISIISKKRSGKTTLLEKLIPELKQRGYRVAVVKHDTHGFDIDHEGKDTYRHKAAGAGAVLISSPWKISLIQDVSDELSLDQIVNRYLNDYDLVLTEGYKKANKAAVEVFRSTAHQTPLYTKSDTHPLIAVMSDIPVDLGVPNFDINAIDTLADLIEQQFLIR